MVTYQIDGEITEGSTPPLLEFLMSNPGPVDVTINSPGGNAIEGAAQMAAIESHGQVNIWVRGIAASAATLPMIAGRTIHIHTSALIMIHNPSAFTFGTADEHRKSATALDKMGDTYAQSYARFTGHPVDRIAAWMAEETWLTAQEALDLNFCDQIEGQSEQAEMVAAFNYTRFRHPPDNLKAIVAKNGWATASPKSQKKRTADA